MKFYLEPASEKTLQKRGFPTWKSRSLVGFHVFEFHQRNFSYKTTIPFGSSWGYLISLVNGYNYCICPLIIQPPARIWLDPRQIPSTHLLWVEYLETGGKYQKCHAYFVWINKYNYINVNTSKYNTIHKYVFIFYKCAKINCTITHMLACQPRCCVGTGGSSSGNNKAPVLMASTRLAARG